MRFPSLIDVSTTARDTLLRFPLVLAVAIVAAGAAMVLFDGGRDDGAMRFLAIATLGLPLLTALAVGGERWSQTHVAGHPGAGKRPAAFAVLPSLGGLAVLVLLFALWPCWTDAVAWRRYVQLSLAFHLLAAWLPHAFRDERNGFWQYNRTLFLRFLVGALYTHVLFAGITGALLALDNLFGLDVPGETYMRLYSVTAFVFQSWFFLSGIPRDFRALERDESYPLGLKVFSQFILAPIVILYLLILTAYMGKIAFTQAWPSGWIGYLVSSVSVLGILSLLLLHPIQERRENHWVKTYARGFYLALFPSLIMLLFAIYKRVSQYGITENRYFLIVIALWLMGIAVYGVATRARRLKAIPVTLSLVALVTALGPWGAYAVSRSSQRARLEALLSSNGLLVDDRVVKATDEVTLEDLQQMSAVLRYLVQTHGEQTVENAFSWPPEVESSFSEGSQPEDVERARSYMARIGLEYVWPQRRPQDIEHFSLHVGAPYRSVPIGGYEHAVRIDGFPADLIIDERPYRLALDAAGAALALAPRPAEEAAEAADTLSISLDPIFQIADAQLEAPGHPPGQLDEAVVLHGRSAEIEVLARVWRAHGQRTDETTRVNYLQLDLYVRFSR